MPKAGENVVDNEDVETADAFVDVDENTELINVKSTGAQNKDKSWPVAFFEKDERHPEGQAFIGDGKVHQVANTRGVAMAVKDGKLKQVTKKG